MYVDLAVQPSGEEFGLPIILLTCDVHLAPEIFLPIKGEYLPQNVARKQLTKGL